MAGEIYSADGDVIRRVKVDPVSGDFSLQVSQNVDKLLADVKARRDTPVATDKALRHVARVPLTVLERSMREGWFHDDDAWKRWANDPDNRDFRVYEGRI